MPVGPGDAARAARLDRALQLIGSVPLLLLSACCMRTVIGQRFPNPSVPLPLVVACELSIAHTAPVAGNTRSGPKRASFSRSRAPAGQYCLNATTRSRPATCVGPCDA